MNCTVIEQLIYIWKAKKDGEKYNYKAIDYIIINNKFRDKQILNFKEIIIRSIKDIN
ncbi:hypothetical protein UT300013_01780 [Paraclostridium sordellii]|uniref:hypothetical protein n=1 Tax=Paraclostridium sordellii TaxID=1505 RepID=UPI000A9BC35A|nr:hypothetical protein [Paeniclostridium sordellii]